MRVFVFENPKYPVEGRYCAVMCNGGEWSFAISSDAQRAKEIVEGFKSSTDVTDVEIINIEPSAQPIRDAIASSGLTPLTTIRMLLEKNALYYYDTKAPYPRKVLCIADAGYTNSPTFIGFGGLEVTAKARVLLAVEQYIGGIPIIYPLWNSRADIFLMKNFNCLYEL